MILQDLIKRYVTLLNLILFFVVRKIVRYLINENHLSRDQLLRAVGPKKGCHFGNVEIDSKRIWGGLGHPENVGVSLRLWTND